jgi:hypothetical protein
MRFEQANASDVHLLLLCRERQADGKAPAFLVILTFAIYSPMLSAMSSSWVVPCTGCGCSITCFAIDPQTEHMHPSDAPPQSSAVVTCSCCWGAYRYSGKQIVHGTPRRNPACARATKREPKPDGAMLIAASVVAAIRLRGEEIKASPSLNAVIQDSITLSRSVLDKIERS